MTNRKAPPSLGPASVSIGSLRGPIGQTGMMGLDGADANEPIPIQGPQGLIGNTGFQGIPGIGVDGDIGPEALMIPGNPGQQGGQGYQGIPGIALDGDIGPEAMMIPGNPGPQGGQGIQGFQGNFGLDGDPGEDTFPIPSPPGNTGAVAKATATGTVTTTAALQDITDASVALPAPGTWAILGTFYAKVNNALNDRTFEGHLDVGGVDQTDIASVVFGTLVNDIVEATQSWIITVSTAQTIKLRTKHSGGTTGDFTTQTTCVIIAIQAGGTATANLTSVHAELGSPQTVASSGVIKDIMTLSISGAGTWFVSWRCSVYHADASNAFAVWITDGTTDLDGADNASIGWRGDTKYEGGFIYVATGAVTLTMKGKANATNTVQPLLNYGSTTAPSTRMAAIRIALN